jgi:hypothetical protein
VTVLLTGVDGRRARIALQGVNGTLDAAASVGFLVGDEDSNGSVDASDVLRMKGRQGQTVNATNFPYDVDLDGGIGTNDLLNARSNAGTTIR